MMDIMKERWRNVFTLLLGSWLVVSPFIFPTIKGTPFSFPTVEGTSGLYSNALIVGVLVQMTAAWAILSDNTWKDWILLILGSWLLSSSYFFDNGVLLTGLQVPLAANLFIVASLLLINATFGLFREQAILDMDRPIGGLTYTDNPWNRALRYRYADLAYNYQQPIRLSR